MMQLSDENHKLPSITFVINQADQVERDDYIVYTNIQVLKEGLESCEGPETSDKEVQKSYHF